MSEVQRAAFEHAIAVLIGKPASAFSHRPAAARYAPPAVIPPGLPSDLARAPSRYFRRRTPRAGSERQHRRRASAAYYPLVTLSGVAAALRARSFTTLIQGPSGLWIRSAARLRRRFSMVACAAEPASRPAPRTTIRGSDYPPAILIAFQEVEDNLAALRILEDEAATQARAVAAAATFRCRFPRRATAAASPTISKSPQRKARRSPTK